MAQSEIEKNFPSENIRFSTKRYTDIMLGCLVLGGTFFYLNIDTKTILNISFLQKAIKKEKENDFRGIDPDNLKLWKVEIPARDNVVKQLMSNAEIDIDSIAKDLGGAVFLDPMLNITRYFPEKYIPPEEHVHIIVQPPSLPATTGKRKMEDSDEGAGKKKLMVAQKEAEDETKIKRLIDNLSSIDTSQQVFDVPPLPGDDNTAVKIYKRRCYDYYRNFIFNSKSHSRFLITGNPGIGKTFFGRLMLVELLKRNKPVLFDCKDCTLYIGTQGECFKVNGYEYKLFAKDDTWCIIDGKKPQVSHDWSTGKFIMVSSPKREIIADFDKPSCKTLYMPTWNRDELLECWKDLYKSNITEEEIETKFGLCGGIPRWIFDSKKSSEEIRTMIISASQSIDQCILDYQAKLFFGYEFSHKIIQIHTNSEDTEDPYTRSFCLFASKYAGSKCLEYLKKHNKEKLRTFIDTARDIREMAALRGQLFELISHEILRRGGKFLVRKLTDKDPEPDVFKEFELNLEEKFFWSINDIRDDIQQQRPTKYYRPLSGTFESIDSYVHPNKMFQVTISKRHSVKQDGLRSIKETLDETSEINIYFVLPRDKFINFTKQTYENNGSGKVFDPWINNIVQYALCIDLDNYCTKL